MQKWEYMRKRASADKMNIYGKQGWELVCVTLADPGSPQAYFKRPLK